MDAQVAPTKIDRVTKAADPARTYVWRATVVLFLRSNVETSPVPGRDCSRTIPDVKNSFFLAFSRTRVTPRHGACRLAVGDCPN